MTAAHPSANSPLKGEALSLSCLPLIDEVTAQLCRRHRLSSDESEDFKSDVRLHFRHRDFDPLRRFEGLSSLPTYLTLVISRLFLDHRNGLSGRWRTSTEAKRLGPSAIPIERLVAHDAWTSDRVVAMFRINHRRHVGFGSFALSPTGEPSIGPQGDCLLGLA